MMRDNYKKLNSSCMRLSQAPCSDFCLWYCATKSVAFFWIFSIFSPHRECIAISSCSCMITLRASFDSFGAVTFFSQESKQKRQKNGNCATSVYSHMHHLSPAEPHTICCYRCCSADMDSQLKRSSMSPQKPRHPSSTENMIKLGVEAYLSPSTWPREHKHAFLQRFYQLLGIKIVVFLFGYRCTLFLCSGSVATGWISEG